MSDLEPGTVPGAERFDSPPVGDLFDEEQSVVLLVGPWSRLELGPGVLYLRTHPLGSCLHAYFDGRLRAGAAVDHGIGDQLGDKQAHVVADATQ